MANRYFFILIAFGFGYQTLFGQHNHVKHTAAKSAFTQVIVAYADTKNAHTGELYGLEFINKQWQVTLDTIPCSLGKKGFAAFNQKREGDGKTPSGKFSLDFAFGYVNDLDAKMEFVTLNERHFWVSDVTSEYYNTLIDYDPKDAYSEKMKRNDHLYKYGIVIGYNTKKVVRGKGSAIFIHVHRREGAPTAGCVAIAEEKMKALIQWIQPQKSPVIVMGEKPELPLLWQTEL